MKHIGSNRMKIYKLSQEDYEHIWLRVKEKGKYWVFGWISFITAVVTITIGFGINNYVKSRVDSQIQSLINSDTFKKEVLSSLEEKLILNNKSFSELIEKNNKTYSELLNRIRKIDALKSIPIKCFDRGFEITDLDGKTIKIEYGRAITGANIPFELPFNSVPSVFLTQSSSPIVRIMGESNKPILFSMEMVNKNFFRVKRVSQSYDIARFDWIAIGN